MSVAGVVGKIRVLPGDVASRIAAGEVVERPAAVVKELIENSLDAGSAKITVEVTDGGRGLIRVVDDGEGMSPVDAALAFQRHATSKLQSERDLFAIRTLGFRGEALPSIAAVSKVRLVTVCRGEPVGTKLLLTGGTLTKREETASAPGTQIDVEDLFFNTPARKKFLKTPATEFSHICQVVQQASLAWPGTQFRLKHNGQDVFDYPPVASRRDRVLQVYGARFVEQAAAVLGAHPGIRFEGVTVKPTHVRAGKAPQDLFVNRRAVKNPAVSRAVYDAYGTYLARGCHPVFALFLDLDPDRVDVNVHPTKREVRFADQDLVYRAVRQAVREAIGASPQPEAATRQWPFDSAQGRELVERSFVNREQISSQTMPGTGRQEMLAGMAGDISPAGGEVREPAQSYAATLDQGVIPLGQIGRTYLVAQVGSELHVIDQHTAHERVLFERLCRAQRHQAIPSQPLLIPETVELPPHGALLLNRHQGELEQIGLKIEPFGAQTFMIRAIPALLKPLDYAALLLDLAEELSQWNTASPLETRLRSVLASVACHGAVRAGRAMELPEIKQLIEDWREEGLPTTCPHGRRVALRLPAEELARLFGRS